MSLFKWLEKILYLGDIIHDYGIIEERRSGIVRTRVSLFLCRREEKLQIVIKESNVAFLGASVRYTYIRENSVEAFTKAVDNAYQIIQSQR